MGNPPTPPPSQTADKATNEIFGRLASDILKYFPVGLAAIYIMGFIIVAVHLAGYGASPLDLIRVQYLAAGFWFGVFVALYLVVRSLMRTYLDDIIGTRNHMLSNRTIGLLKPVLTALAFSILAITGPIFAKIVWVIHHKQPSESLTFWSKNIALVVVGLAVFDFFLQIFRSLKFNKDEKKGLLHRLLLWGAVLYSLITACGGLQLCIREFAQRIYANIPFSLGGGQPRQVVFWLGPNAPNLFLERDGANSCGGTNPYSIQYELLVENENTLVVISPKANQRIIQFDRKSVEAVIVLGTRPPSAPANFVRGITENLKCVDSNTANK